VSMGGRAEGLACADPGARTPIGASGNFVFILFTNHRKDGLIQMGLDLHKHKMKKKI
jgi:hypothetical protein